MKNLALKYYRSGYGCSQCILKAAETKYGVRLDENSYRVAGALNTGMGIGATCTVLIACVMVLGLLFDEETVKKHRIVFLSEFHRKYGEMGCGRISTSGRGGGNCADVVYDAVALLDEIIQHANPRFDGSGKNRK